MYIVLKVKNLNPYEEKFCTLLSITQGGGGKRIKIFFHKLYLHFKFTIPCNEGTSYTLHKFEYPNIFTNINYL